MGRVLVICSDTQLGTKLKRSLDNVATVLHANPLTDSVMALANQFSPDLVVVDSDARNGIATTYERISEVRRLFPEVPLIVIGNETGAQLILTAMRAGAEDFLDHDASEQEIKSLVLRHLNKNTVVRKPSRSRSISILSATGSDENHDLGVNIAALIASQQTPEHSAIFVDLSIPCGASAIALDLKAQFFVPDAVKDITRLDRVLLDSAVARCPRSGLYLLPLGDKDEDLRSSIEVQDIRTLIDMLRSLYDVVVVHYGLFSTHESLLSQIDGSSLALLGCNQRFSSVRASNDLLKAIRKNHTPDNLIVVVHEFMRHMVPGFAHLSDVFHPTPVARLMTSWDELADAANSGNPLALSNSVYRAQILAILQSAGFPDAAATMQADSFWDRARRMLDKRSA